MGILTTLPVLASALWFQAGQTVPETVEQVRSTLRGDAADLLLGVILAVIGSLAILLFSLRWKSRDPTLISFGFFSGLYGLRLLVETPTVWFLFEAPESLWRYLGAFITYVILVPATFFWLETVFKGLQVPRRLAVGAVVTFVTVATLSDLIQGLPGTAMLANNILVIIIFLFSLLALFRWRRTVDTEVRALRIGFIVFGILALHANLVGMNLMPGPGNLEPLGFLVLVVCLGFVVASRISKNQERLLAIQEELKMARQIQASILPRTLPSIPGLDIAVRYVPMNSVAGDFYDFLIVDERRLGVFVADVSGHGVPAALIASMVKIAFASQEPHASDPAQVLCGLNRILSGQLQGQFITASYLFLDVEKRVMSYAAAGHPPLFLWRKEDRKVHTIMENGVVLGLYPQAKYSTAEFRIEPGDRCLLYTDGILEATNAADEFFGEARVKQFIEAQRELPAGQFSDSLLANLSSWSRRPPSESPEDDMTLLVVDFKDSESLHS